MSNPPDQPADPAPPEGTDPALPPGGPFVPPAGGGQAPPPLHIRILLIFTCTAVSFAHGGNDGQKGMGLIMLILIGVAPTAYALNEVEIEPLSFGEDHTAFLEAVARENRRGLYPRGFFGEQPYWTLVGVDGAPTPEVRIDPARPGEPMLSTFVGERPLRSAAAAILVIAGRSIIAGAGIGIVAARVEILAIVTRGTAPAGVAFIRHGSSPETSSCGAASRGAASGNYNRLRMSRFRALDAQRVPFGARCGVVLEEGDGCIARKARLRERPRLCRGRGGAVAQMGERCNRTAEVRGSIPLGSTTPDTLESATFAPRPGTRARQSGDCGT